MTAHDKDKIIAAYLQVSDGREWAINGVDDPIPAFYAIAFEAGAASRDAEIAELVATLEAITDPINYMKANLPEGARLNGAMAVQLSESPSYLKKLANNALAKVRKP